MKKCPICKSKFVGRSDKQYCSVRCKSSHHNQRKRAGEYLSTTDGVEGLKTSLMQSINNCMNCFPKLVSEINGVKYFETN